MEGTSAVGLCDPAWVSARLSFGGGPRRLKFSWQILNHQNQLMGGLCATAYSCKPLLRHGLQLQAPMENPCCSCRL